MSDEKRNFFTVKEIRKAVFDDQISITTIHKLIKRGEIPYTDFCRKRLIPAWWAEQTLARAHEGGNE